MISSEQDKPTELPTLERERRQGQGDVGIETVLSGFMTERPQGTFVSIGKASVV